MPNRHTPLSLAARAAFAFIAINALAGAGALLLFPSRTDSLFFWEIRPPINAALFGALYLGGGVVVGWLTLRGEWERARFLVPVLVCAGVLISLVTLLHLERFSPGFKLAYWLVVYIGAPLLALLFYAQHERRGADWSVSQPLAPLTRLLAVGLGGVLLALGLLLIAWPQPAVAAWPWQTSPLMIRIFAAWFSAFGAGLLWFARERDWGRLRHIADLMIAASALDLLMVFIHRADLAARGPRLWVYLFHLALLGVMGGLMHWLQRRPAGVLSAPARS